MDKNPHAKADRKNKIQPNGSIGSKMFKNGSAGLVFLVRRVLKSI